MLKFKHYYFAGIIVTFIAAATVGTLTRVLVHAEANPNSTDSVLNIAASGAPPLQAEVLADGTVTLAEANVAVARAAECATARGVDVEVREGSAKVPDSIGFAVPTLDEGEAARKSLRECQVQHSDRVLTVFGAQSRPSVDQVSAGREFIRRCMAARGLPVPDVATEADIIAWASSQIPEVGGPNADCVDLHYRELGYWP